MPFEEILPSTEQIGRPTNDLKHGSIEFAGGQIISHLKSETLLKELVDDQIQKQLEDERSKEISGSVCSHSTDLVPGVYEGMHKKSGSGNICFLSLSAAKRRVANKKRKNRKLNDVRHPWFNLEMENLIKQREKAHRKWLTSKNRKKGDAKWEIFKKIRNQVSTLRHATRNDFLISALRVDGATSAQPWRTKGTFTCIK